MVERSDRPRHKYLRTCAQSLAHLEAWESLKEWSTHRSILSLIRSDLESSAPFLQESKITSESNRTSGASLAYVHTVASSWGWSWQPMSQDIDDGLDGVLFVRAKVVDSTTPNDKRKWTHRLAGSAVLLQVKGGETQVSSQTDEYIRVKVGDLQKHKADWLKSPLPCALVYVEPVEQGKTSTRAWWVNLQDESAYVSEGLVQIPRKNRFQAGLECRGSFSKLVKNQQLSAMVQEIAIDRTSTSSQRVTGLHPKGLKWEAWRFYKEWRLRGSVHPVLGSIVVNRTGWSHLTRQGRTVHRIANSLLLLPAAAQALREVRSWVYLRKLQPCKTVLEDGSEFVIDYLGVRAKVISSWRAPTEIMVVLRRQTTFRLSTDGEPGHSQLAGPPGVQIWFHSVYEPRRGQRK